MSKLWTKSEEAVLFEVMGDKKVMYAPKAREIAKKLPGRTPEAIRRHWLLIRWNQKPKTCLRTDAQKELNHQIELLLDESASVNNNPPRVSPVLIELNCGNVTIIIKHRVE